MTGLIGVMQGGPHIADEPTGDPAPQRSSLGVPGGRVRPATLFRWGAYTSLGVLATAAAAMAVYTARGVLILALIALFLAVSLDPAVRALSRWHIRRGLAILVVVLVVLGLVAAFLQSVIPTMAEQFQAMVKDFPHYLASLQHRSAGVRQISGRYHLTSQISKLFASLPGRLSSGALGISRRVFSALAATLTVAVLTIYFLVDLPRLRRSAVLLFPRAHRARFSRVAEVMVDKVGSYMLGNILVSLVAGLAAFAALTALRVPFAVPLAFVVAVTDLIPMIGATLGAVVCITVALLATRLWPTTVLVAAFFVVYQQLENYLIAPRIMRGQVQLSPAAVLLAGLIGGTALGLVGALMAIPIAAGLKVLLTERLQARDAADTDAADTDAADTDAAAPGNAAPASHPSAASAASPRAPRSDPAQPGNRRRGLTIRRGPPAR
jgi:predicted PurR-regulated permease PerM